MRKHIHRFAILASVALVLGGAAVRPPPGGGTGGGKIYYMHVANSTPWSMNSDGSSPASLQSGAFGPVSRALHNNHRWFLDTRAIPDSYYENGEQRYEVFALRDDYGQIIDGTTRVQLTDDITLRPAGNGLWSIDWVAGDTAVSFLACRWAGSVLVEGGIYTATLAFGADGNIIGLTAQPTIPAVPFPPDGIHSYSWNPGGTRVVYGNGTGLWVADRLGSPHQMIFNGSARAPQWSPDDSKIAFGSNGNIWTIRPNGTQPRQIITRNSQWGAFDRAFWSPTGTHIVCYASMAWGQPYNFELFRATATGGSLTNLTNTVPDGSVHPTEFAEMTLGWR